MFQVFGVINDYFKKRGNITEADLGRFNVTGNIADRHAFKVPSLRMAAHTAPYLHDGSAATLRDAVDAMFEFQLGREAPDEDKEAIVAFIETLAGNPIDPDFLPGAVAAADGVPSAPAQGSRGKGGRVGQRAVAAAEEVLPAPAQGSRGKGGRVGQR
jgi:cytochrome c peroxidase